MKKLIVYFIALAYSQSSFSQMIYNDFEGNKYHDFGYCSGALDTAFLNPKTNVINSSQTCAKYIRGNILFDFITIYPYGVLENPEIYANYDTTAPKFKLKLLTTAPVGTFVELQLGTSSDSSYPSGIHSQYQAITTKMNDWEELNFTFAQKPNGSNVTDDDVDKVIILFYPYSTNRDNYYFDDFTGPGIVPRSINNNQQDNFNLSLYPNPSSLNSQLIYTIEKDEFISIKLYNSLGQLIKVIKEQNITSGNYTENIDLIGLPDGVYNIILSTTNQSVRKALILKK